VIDNASLHVSKTVPQAQTSLTTSSLYVDVLPPFGKGPNVIEPVFQQIMCQEIPRAAPTPDPGSGGPQKDAPTVTAARSHSTVIDEGPLRARRHTPQ
jgi:hypothetical protein